MRQSKIAFFQPFLAPATLTGPLID